MLRHLCFLILCWLGLSSTSLAHLMVNQKGTLNLSGTGAYLLVSIPTSALVNVDDDRDGLLSSQELEKHTVSIRQQLKAGLKLNDTGGARPLEGLMLTLSPKNGQENEPADQLIVMGRYALTDPAMPLTFSVALWGKAESERSLAITMTKDLKNAQAIMLSAKHPSAGLYESGWIVFIRYFRQGLEHVLTGLDHLLFLLVVIFTLQNWKRLFSALSLFTVGHAISLAVVVFGGLIIPARIVEPAIAATIVGLALFDVWAARQPQPPSLKLLLALVFSCSLIHGLGLGGALAELGLNPSHQGVSMLGFNLGIETAQISVSLVTLAALALIRILFGLRGILTASSLATMLAIIAGSIWFVQRVIGSV